MYMIQSLAHLASGFLYSLDPSIEALTLSTPLGALREDRGAGGSTSRCTQMLSVTQFQSDNQNLRLKGADHEAGNRNRDRELAEQGSLQSGRNGLTNSKGNGRSNMTLIESTDSRSDVQIQLQIRDSQMDEGEDTGTFSDHRGS